MKRVPLTQGLVALVDDEDYDRVMAFKWYASVEGNVTYARRSFSRPDGRRTSIGLHTFLTGSARVDHINLDGLDNRRVNLRPATRSQNGRNARLRSDNTSGFKGVFWNSRGRKWQAQIYLDGKLRYLGLHATPESAARAYDAAALDLFGEFARLNFEDAA